METIPPKRRGPVCPAYAIPWVHYCWWPGHLRNKGIIRHGIDLVLLEMLEYSGFSTKPVFLFTDPLILPHSCISMLNHCGQWCQMVSAIAINSTSGTSLWPNDAMSPKIWVTIGSGACWLPDSTKPPPEPRLTSHEWDTKKKPIWMWF